MRRLHGSNDMKLANVRRSKGATTWACCDAIAAVALAVGFLATVRNVVERMLIWRGGVAMAWKAELKTALVAWRWPWGRAFLGIVLGEDSLDCLEGQRVRGSSIARRTFARTTKSAPPSVTAF